LALREGVALTESKIPARTISVERGWLAPAYGRTLNWNITKKDYYHLIF
jgi:hypothetical protein